MSDANTNPELPAWPELENAAQAARGTGTTSALPHEIARSTGSATLEPLLSSWDPLVTHLLERIARLTAWHTDLADLTGYSQLVPLGIATYVGQDAITWRVGSTQGLMWGNAGTAREEYFTVTLNTTQDGEPAGFVVLSRTLKINARPNVRDLKAALVRAYSDGPAFTSQSWATGTWSASKVVQEITIGE